MIKQNCAHCKTTLASVGDDDCAEEQISHGICRDCLDVVMAGSIRIPACLDLDTVGGQRSIRYLISTEYVANTVFLRIDDAQPDYRPLS